jgi:hypothetical protein
MLNATGALFGGNVALSAAGVTGISGAATTFSTGATAVTYAIQGKLFSKAQVAGAATPTVDVVTGVSFKAIQKNQGCAFVWTLDAAGNYGLAQGALPVQAGTVSAPTTVDDGGNWTAVPQFPAIPDTLTPVAYMIVRATSAYAGVGFLPGSAVWNTAGIVITTPQSVFALPASPQTA